MRLVSQCTFAFIMGLLCCSISLLHLDAQTIEPTRTLKESVEEMGKLTVSSEPPGLNVILDGASLGYTPVIRKEVKPGSHVLYVKDADTEISILPGESLLLSYYKGAFIEVLEKEKEPEREQKVKDQEVARETEDEEKTRGKKVYKPPSSLYWPENPAGPIYPPE